MFEKKTALSGLTALLAAALVAGYAADCKAALKLRITSVAATQVEVEDGVAPDPLANSIVGYDSGTSGTIDGVFFDTDGFGRAIIFDVFGGEGLHLHNITISSIFAGPVKIELSETGFPGAIGPGVLVTNVGGTFVGAGGTATFQSYVSSTNSDYSTGGTAYTSGPFVFSSVGGFSNSFPGSFAPHGGFVGPHSMYMVADVIFGSGGGTISFDLDSRIYGPGEFPPPVPEPTSIALWCMGLGIVGAMNVRKRLRRA